MRVTVGADHIVRLPSEVPPGDAEIIVLVPEQPSPSARAERERLFGILRDKVVVSDDFDSPLPDDLLDEIEGSTPT